MGSICSGHGPSSTLPILAPCFQLAYILMQHTLVYRKMGFLEQVSLLQSDGLAFLTSLSPMYLTIGADLLPCNYMHY